jgi:hypothetical protein
MGEGRVTAIAAAQALAALRASRLHNRLVAAESHWGPTRTQTVYRQIPSAERIPHWTAESGSVPVLPESLERSLARERRRRYWNTFLAIPDPALDLLPEKLLPGDQEGRWPVRWWHRLYWHTVRRLLMTPVWILAPWRGALGGRRRPRRRTS